MTVVTPSQSGTGAFSTGQFMKPKNASKPRTIHKTSLIATSLVRSVNGNEQVAFLRGGSNDHRLDRLRLQRLSVTMNYRRLGRSGLKVSRALVRLLGHLRQSGRYAHGARVDGCGLRLRGQFFDNAEIYARGQSEEIMGAVLKDLAWPRLKYVVSTKFYWGMAVGKGDFPNERNTLNRKYLRQAIDGSLKRLQLDYRRSGVLPSRRPKHADRGNRVGDARHGRARPGALLGHSASGPRMRFARRGRLPTSATCTSR